jgi:histidyl-tRNA synthetase
VLGTAEDPHGEESDVSPFQGKTQVDAFPQESRQEKIADRARSGFTFGQLFTCSISFRKLTHVNVNERLTCDQILDLLKSEKWPNEINTMIQQNKKVPRLQSKQFEKMLTSKTGEEINAMVVFTSTAARIFELHGARDIRLPMFLPNYSHHSDNLTTLINRHGNSTSLANTSRVAFSYYVTRNDIKSIRRYSIGRVFEEGYFTPTEYDECIFQAISPKPGLRLLCSNVNFTFSKIILEDHVNDAECLYIAKKMCDSIFPTRQNEVLFFINHGFIYSHILKRCKIEKKNAVILTNLMINLSNQLATEGQILEALLSIGLSSESVNCILNSRKIGRVEEAEREMWRTKSKQRNQAFKQLKNVVDFASKFGINPDNIFLDPLLVNMTQGSGLMFKVVLKDQTVIATGGRFESLLKKCGKKIGPNLSAVDISFKVENILELLKKQHSSVSLVDVAIRTKNKETAIPLFTQLLSRGVRCEVVTKQESIQEISAIVVIELGEVNATVKIPLGLTTSEGLKLPKNKWKLTDDSFSDYIVDLVSTFGF